MAAITIRNFYISYTFPLHSYKYRLFQRTPEPGVSWNTFIDVFDTHYWLSLMFLFVICSVFYCLCIIVAELQSGNHNVLTCRNICGHLLSGITMVGLSLLAQDVNLVKQRVSSVFSSIKVLVLSICLFGAFSYYAYHAQLTSFLTVRKIEVPISELSDFVAKKSYQLILKRGGSVETYFTESHDPLYQYIWGTVLRSNITAKTEIKAEQLILEDKYKIYFGSSPQFEMNSRSFPCHIVGSSFGYGSHSQAYGMQKGSPYLKMFSHNIQNIKETGAINELYSREKMNQKRLNKCSDGGYSENIGYRNIFSAFVVLAFGCVVGIAVSYTHLTLPTNREV